MGTFSRYIEAREAQLAEGKGNPLQALFAVGNRIGGIAGGATAGLGTVVAGLLAGVAGGVVGGIEGLGGIPDDKDPSKRSWSGRKNGPFGALYGMARNALKRAWQAGSWVTKWAPTAASYGYHAGSNLLPESTGGDPVKELVDSLRPLLGSGDKALDTGADRIVSVLSQIPKEEWESVVRQAADELGVEIKA